MLDKDVIYTGNYKMTDLVKIETGEEMAVGKLLLSPTRTYAPVVKAILETHFEQVHGMIHSSGGGQTKCLKYLPGPMRVVKDNLFKPPVIFDLIRKSSGADDREMYQVFNMGQRLEIYTILIRQQMPSFKLSEGSGWMRRLSAGWRNLKKKSFLLIREKSDRVLMTVWV